MEVLMCLKEEGSCCCEREVAKCDDEKRKGYQRWGKSRFIPELTRDNRASESHFHSRNGANLLVNWNARKAATSNCAFYGVGLCFANFKVAKRCRWSMLALFVIPDVDWPASESRLKHD